MDQYQVRRYDAWYAHITLAMAAAAFLTIIRAAEADKGGTTSGDDKDGLIPPTVNEIRRLFATLLLTARHTTKHVLAWSDLPRNSATNEPEPPTTANDSNASEATTRRSSTRRRHTLVTRCCRWLRCGPAVGSCCSSALLTAPPGGDGLKPVSASTVSACIPTRRASRSWPSYGRVSAVAYGATGNWKEAAWAVAVAAAAVVGAGAAVRGARIAVNAIRGSGKAGKFGGFAGKAVRGVSNLFRRGCGSRNSFSPETIVLMADGTHVPISELQVGDLA